jgi:hypothetical protein
MGELSRFGRLERVRGSRLWCCRSRGMWSGLGGLMGGRREGKSGWMDRRRGNLRTERRKLGEETGGFGDVCCYCEIVVNLKVKPLS